MNTTIDFQVNRPLCVLVTLLGLTLLFNSTGHAADAGRVAGDLQVEGLWFTGDSNKTVIRKPTDFPAPWTISGTDIYYSGGNVGIGTLAPSSELEVAGICKAKVFIGGQNNTTTSNLNAFIGGGNNNSATGYASGVSNGVSNTANGNYSFVGGGSNNTVQTIQSAIIGGYSNTVTASGGVSTIAGGNNNTINAVVSFISGGEFNVAGAGYSWVGGFRGKVRDPDTAGTYYGDQGTFLWSDYNNYDFPSTNRNEFAVRATGGVRFVTAIDGTGAPTKTTSIDSNGNLVVAGSVNVGNTTPVSNFSVTSGNYSVDDLWSGNGTVNGFEVGGSGTDRYVSIKRDGGNSALNISKGTTGASGLITFWVKGAAVGSVTTSGTTTAFNTTSDARLKKNISPTAFTVDDLMNLKVRDYSYIADTASTPQTGFIAQELNQIIPQAVSVGGDDPSVNPWQVDYGKLTPFLVKAVQDLKQRNDHLETENDVLKTRLERLEKIMGITE